MSKYLAWGMICFWAGWQHRKIKHKMGCFPLKKHALRLMRFF